MTEKKVISLTAEQESQLPLIAEEFIKRGLSTDQDLNVENLTQIFNKMYEFGNLPSPKYGVVLVDSPLAIQQKYEKLTGDKTSQLGNMLYGSYSAGWLSYYETFIRLTPEVEGLDSVKPHIDLVGKVSFYLPLEHIVIVSRNPVRISMVNEVLHDASGQKAVEYADGFGVYSLFGTQVSEGTIKAVLAKDANAIMAISNVEERLVAMKAVGPENLLQVLKGVELQRSENGEYVLFEVEIEGEKNKLLKLRNPSEPKDHYEFVPPEVTTISQALAWRIGWDSYLAPVAKT